MIHQNLYRYTKWLTTGAIIFLQTVLLFFIPRSDFIATFTIFLLLFALYFFVIKNENIFSFQVCIGLAILLRMLALLSVPALSDDYFRFIWDGKMTLLHINPFKYTPQEYVQSHTATPYLQQLYKNMNSPEYHTVYPPVMQFIFTAAAFAGGNNDRIALIVMKLFIAAAELGSTRILYLLVKKNNMPVRNILWYILNPLIITELTGNVHFEGVLIFFFLLFLYYMQQEKIFFAAIFFALAVCTKIIPLMLVPLIMRWVGLKKSLIFSLVSAAIVILLFIPFIDENLIHGMSKSLRLFFHLFEFNASVFYFTRWVGYFFVDYDIIEEAAPVLAVISFIVILIISFWPSKKIFFIEKCLWIFSVYFLFSTMVHPWYIAIIIALAAISRFRFPLVFSLLILLSYYPYSMQEYNEDNSLWITAIEYSFLFIFAAWEFFKLKKRRIYFDERSLF